MWVSDQRQTSAIVELRGVDLVLLDPLDGEDYLSPLPHNSGSLQMDRSCIDVVGEALQKTLLHSWVVEGHDLVILLLLRPTKLGQLFCSDLNRLLSQHLRSETVRPTVPVTFLIDDVHQRELLLTIRTDNVLLSNDGSEGVLGIAGHVLKDLSDGRSLSLVRVEPNIDTLREIVCVNSHSLDVVVALCGDSNLGVACVSHVQIGNAPSNFDDAVHLRTAVFGVAYGQTVELHLRGILNLTERHTAVLREILDHANLVPVEEDVLSRHSGRGQHLHNGVVSRIADLFDLDAVDFVTLSL